MDIVPFEEEDNNIKRSESSSNVLDKDCKTFYLLNPDGILDSVAGLENLCISYMNISYKPIKCYKCLSFFECENNCNFIRCPKCKIINSVVPHDKLGRKVIIVICYQCNNRNITNIECIYIRCYLCNSINYSKYTPFNINIDETKYDNKFKYKDKEKHKREQKEKKKKRIKNNNNNYNNNNNNNNNYYYFKYNCSNKNKHNYTNKKNKNNNMGKKIINLFNLSTMFTCIKLPKDDTLTSVMSSIGEREINSDYRCSRKNSVRSINTENNSIYNRYRINSITSINDNTSQQMNNEEKQQNEDFIFHPNDFFNNENLNNYSYGERLDEEFIYNNNNNNNNNTYQRKHFSNEPFHGYAPDGRFIQDDNRKKFIKTGNNNNNYYNNNYNNYNNYNSSEPFNNEYIRNPTNNYNNINNNYIPKNNNNNNYIKMNDNRNMYIKDSNKGMYNNNNNMMMMNHDYNNYKQNYYPNNPQATWNKDNKIYPSNDYKSNRQDNYYDRIGGLVENGNVKKKAMMFNNMAHDSSSKHHASKNQSLLDIEKQKENDVKACIEYFNKLKKGNDINIKTILERGNYKELNIPKEHLENGIFYKNVEFYQKHNLKNYVDHYNKTNAVVENKNYINKDLSKHNNNEYYKDKHLNADNKNKFSDNSNINNSNNKYDEDKNKKNKRSANDLYDTKHSNTYDANANNKKKIKNENARKPTFYTKEELIKDFFR
ncbi:conserved Plasmodium protein, unknown function [Plasmodium sp. gorilla clade G2]|uniref:conserved Plasmodium protein, unknown function n=1 Tax=Plasmodium sp. gorilla clade G2 TaxID=880535 RepID=UPI000D20FA77|nr:conserved Plasmodium protein, unknown function [Plasmodium sp. gorilla clade G2]SOV13619.1 conserved Plasmodium protein, unknown function [Plasmodium sp. gorilla clade G2]